MAVQGYQEELQCCSSSSSDKPQFPCMCRGRHATPMHANILQNGIKKCCNSSMVVPADVRPCLPISRPVARVSRCRSSSSTRAGSRQQLAAAQAKGPVVVIDNYDSFTYNLCQVSTWTAVELPRGKLGRCWAVHCGTGPFWVGGAQVLLPLCHVLSPRRSHQHLHQVEC